jgi:hypothetical protein
MSRLKIHINNTKSIYIEIRINRRPNFLKMVHKLNILNGHVYKISKNQKIYYGIRYIVISTLDFDY